MRRNEIFTVSFDICCETKQKLKVMCLCGYGDDNVAYAAEVELVGNGKWQRITVESGRFKTENDGRQMSDDVKVQALQYSAEKEFIINNIFLV